MEEITYLDLDLLIQRTNIGYRAQVLNSPAGQAAVEFSPPFTNMEVENFLLRIGRPRRGVRRHGSPEMETAKTFGRRLFDSVFSGDVRSCFLSSQDEAARQGQGLRIRLRLADAPELIDLPWEYLYYPALNRFLTLSVWTPLVRYLDLPERIRPLAVTPPLNVLVMISSPSDYPQLNVEQEWMNLSEALSDLEQRGLVALERIDEATLAVLRRRLQRGTYHIFHFIGHGGFDPQAQDGLLVLEDEKGRGRPVSGHHLGMLLHDHRSLRLAILNACEGARSSPTDVFAGAAQSLVQQGIPAVIAMQFEITDTAAITLAHEFYTVIADGHPVDAALANARQAIFAQGNDVEWGTPVLYLRSPDGCIFKRESAPDVKPPESVGERRQERIAALYTEAQAALAAGEWAAAGARLQAALKLDPTHTEAAAKLKEVQQRQALDSLYTAGERHAEAKRWPEALDAFRQVQKLEGNYQEVKTLIATAERELAREERKRAVLYGEAQKAIAAEQWTVAIEKLQAVLKLDPAYAEAEVKLREVQQQQALASGH